MIAGQIHAVIAAGLKEPALLARWQEAPELLRQYGIEPGAFDLGALWKFAGLTTKVRHNGLRADIPQTFRLLNITGLEIEVFGAYATFHAAKNFGPTVQARIDDLLVFLERWLDFDKLEHALLWDLIRHEAALARLRTLENISGSQIGTLVSRRRPRLSSVPRLSGDVILHEMRSDPRVIETILRHKDPKLEQVPLATSYFGYWHFQGEVYVLELDALGFYLLFTIDGTRSAADLGGLIGASPELPGGLLKSLGDLADIGIITFD